MWRLRWIIDHVFGASEANIIMSIPLSPSSQPDIIIWPFTPSGQYLVKSGYRFLQEKFRSSSKISLRLEVFGKIYGVWRFLAKLKILCSKLVGKLCQSKQTCFTKKSSKMACVKTARRVVIITHIWFSFALMCRLCGTRFKEATCPFNHIYNLSKERKVEFQHLHLATTMI